MVLIFEKALSTGEVLQWISLSETKIANEETKHV